MGAAGVDIADMGDAVVDFVKQLRRQGEPQLPGNGGEVVGGGGGGADGAVDDNSVVKGFLGLEFARGNPLLCQGEDGAARFPGGG